MINIELNVTNDSLISLSDPGLLSTSRVSKKKLKIDDHSSYKT